MTHSKAIKSLVLVPGLAFFLSTTAIAGFELKAPPTAPAPASNADAGMSPMPDGMSPPIAPVPAANMPAGGAADPVIRWTGNTQTNAMPAQKVPPVDAAPFMPPPAPALAPQNKMPALVAPDFVAPPQKQMQNQAGAAQPQMNSAPQQMNSAPQQINSASQPVNDPAALAGFGSDIPLVIALQQIVPPGYQIAFGAGVNPGANVSWNGGKNWQAVLGDTLSSQGLGYNVKGNVVTVMTGRGAPAPAAAKNEIAPMPAARNDMPPPPPVDMPMTPPAPENAQPMSLTGASAAPMAFDTAPVPPAEMQAPDAAPAPVFKKKLMQMSDTASPVPAPLAGQNAAAEQNPMTAEQAVPAAAAAPVKTVDIRRDKPSRLLRRIKGVGKKDGAAVQNDDNAALSGASMTQPSTSAAQPAMTAPVMANTTPDMSAAPAAMTEKNPNISYPPPPEPSIPVSASALAPVSYGKKTSMPASSPMANDDMMMSPPPMSAPSDKMPDLSAPPSFSAPENAGSATGMPSAPPMNFAAASVPDSKPTAPQGSADNQAWHGAQGQSLRDVLKSWSDTAGVELYWSIDYDYRLKDDADFTGSYDEAVGRLMDGFAAIRPQPYGQLHQGSNGGPRVLVVKSYDVTP